MTKWIVGLGVFAALVGTMTTVAWYHNHPCLKYVEVPFVYAPGRGSLARRIPKRALVEWAERRLLGAGQ